MNVQDLQKGEVLAETAFYEATGLAILKNDNDREVKIGAKYVEELLESADYFEREEELNQTDLITKFAEGKRLPMTVHFVKKQEAKKAGDYKKEVKDAIEKVQNAKVSEVEKLLTNLITNPIEKLLPDEERTAIGRHYGVTNEFGRYPFIDMGKEKGTNPAHDGRQIQVDPRTLQFVIVDKVKYKLKNK